MEPMHLQKSNLSAERNNHQTKGVFLKINRLCTAITLAIAALASTTSVNATTGNELHQWLLEARKQRDGKSTGIASGAISLGYVSGIAQVLADLRQVCLPKDGATNGQLVDLVFKTLENNPEFRHLSAAAIVRFSLQESFPCKP